MAALAPNQFLGRALAASMGLHLLVVIVLVVRPFGRGAAELPIPQGVDVGIVNVGDIPNLGGGAAAAGARQIASPKSAPPAAMPEPEPEAAAEPAAVEYQPEPDAVSLAPARPKPKAGSKPKVAAVAKSKVDKSIAKPAVPATGKTTRTATPSGNSGAGAEAGTGSSPSAASALSAVMAKYQKPGGRGDGSGLGDQAGGRDGVGRAGIAADFYHRTLVARIRQYWNVPPGIEAEGLNSIYALVIGRDGSLVSANLVKSSGDRLFDASAEKALHAAAPYNPVPQSIPAPLRVEVRLIPENKN